MAKVGRNFIWKSLESTPHFTPIRVRPCKKQKLNLKKAALKTDLNKSDYEIDLHELQMFRNEVTEVIR